ncbi:glycosyltransferase family 9 protein [[Haemophilus] ducreyi]|nr:glycosyltransferase family 9 protein [[Haemophilus] ducreyi]
MKLANQKYDLVIDPTIALRNRDLLLLRVINAKHYIGYEKTNYQLFDFNIKNEKKHISTVYKRALELIGLNHIDISYDIPLNKDSHERIKIYLSESCLDSFIALNLFGASSTRSFNDNKIYELLEYLKKNTNKPILLLTFPAIARKLKKIACHFSEVFIYEHTKTVFDTIELIRFADLVISPDTSIVHIAVGLNKKLIAFYSLDEQNFIHWQPNNLVETHILRFEHNINEINISEIQAKWLN